MNVKLKFNSSSFVRRKRNVGAEADEERSGSCRKSNQVRQWKRTRDE